MFKKTDGFTLIELVVVIAIIAIFSVVLVPTFRGKKERLTSKEFVAKLNGFMQTAWQRALIAQKVQQIKFNFVNKTIGIGEQMNKKEEKSKFVPVRGEYLDTEMAIPSTYVFRNFYINDKDETRFGKRETAYFYIVPSGLTQPVIINIVNQDEKIKEGEAEKFGLVLNPFSAQFNYYDSFQKP